MKKTFFPVKNDFYVSTLIIYRNSSCFNMSESKKQASSEEHNSSIQNVRTKWPKSKIGLFTPEETFLHDGLDKKCLHKFGSPLVRIEYPGNVKNVDKALETLGGINEIQKAASGSKKLELLFHPRNHYMKGCVADVDQSVGILVKVKQDADTRKASYEVLGATDTTFKFTRMCDFQYLPLLAKDQPETKHSDVEYMHDKIILDKIPNLEWFTKKESSSNPLFLVSGSFARFDQPQGRFQSNSGETFNSMVRSDAPQLGDFGKRKIKQKFLTSSTRINLLKDVEVPDRPPPEVFQNVKSKFLQHHLKVVKQLFDERPIWTKSGIMHKGNINLDSVKHVLPCVAYYCYAGPWRTCWIKFGYNPLKDHNSRIYQVLDFRIRHDEGIQIKIKAKRSVSSKIANEFIKKKVGDHISDMYYIIRPNQIPPARQMFYQYCDILIPEIQEMILKLPKLPSAITFNGRNGWLPLSFQEHCREIVNGYIFDAVRQELLKEANAQKTAKNPEDVATYCSKLLSNIKKGFSQSIGEFSGAPADQGNIIEEIDLGDDDDDDDEQIDANEVMDSLPERLSDNFDDENGEDEDSDLEIDMEAVEEVNKIVAGMKDKN